MRRLTNWLGIAPKTRRTGPARPAAKTKLGMEGLEDRGLMSVSVGWDGGSVLQITGDDSANIISVRDEGTTLRVDVNGQASQPFPDATITSIVINGKGGGDTIRLDHPGQVVSDFALIDGGGGNDIIRGGSAGESLSGGTGNDTIFGNGGADIMSGGDGHDNLYGGSGGDVMNGGAGNDGLFGGIGTKDTMEGGTGSDRFLVANDTSFLGIPGSSDTIVDLNGGDARITFENGSAYVTGTESIPAGVWVDGDVVKVDEALSVLHRRVGNDNLLETNLGFGLTFVRQGVADELSILGAADGGLLGSNAGGRIKLTEQAFDNRLQLLAAVVHEVGHNWDNESPIYEAFKGLSGWRQTAAQGLSSTTAYGETWFFNPNAGYASAYATNHPKDDFAETFALVVLTDAGTGLDARYNTPASLGGAKGASLQAKMDLVRGFISTLGSPV